VDVPGGGLAHIRYSGDVPPQVNFVRVPQTALPAGFFAPSPFAEMARISAMMDRQMAVMMAQARLMQEQAADLENAPRQSAALKALPAAPPYSFISAVPGSGVCVKSVQITATGNGASQVVSQIRGDCGASAQTSESLKIAPALPQAISYKAGKESRQRSGI